MQHKSLIYLDYIDDIEDFQSAIAAWGENPGIDNLASPPARILSFFCGVKRSDPALETSRIKPS